MNRGVVGIGLLLALGYTGLALWLFPVSASIGMLALWLIVSSPVPLIWYVSLRAMFLAPKMAKRREAFFRGLADDLKATLVETRFAGGTYRALIDGIDFQYGIADETLVHTSRTSSGPASFYFFVAIKLPSAGRLTIVNRLAAWKSERRLNFLGIEIKTGQPAIDEDFYVYSDMPEFTGAFLRSPSRLRALEDFHSLCGRFEEQIILCDGVLEARMTLEGDAFSLPLEKINSSMVVVAAKILRVLATDLPVADGEEATRFRAERKAAIRVADQVQSDTFWGMKSWAGKGCVAGAVLAILLTDWGALVSLFLGGVPGALLGGALDFYLSVKAARQRYLDAGGD